MIKWFNDEVQNAAARLGDKFISIAPEVFYIEDVAFPHYECRFILRGEETATADPHPVEAILKAVAASEMELVEFVPVMPSVYKRLWNS